MNIGEICTPERIRRCGATPEAHLAFAALDPVPAGHLDEHHRCSALRRREPVEDPIAASSMARLRREPAAPGSPTVAMHSPSPQPGSTQLALRRQLRRGPRPRTTPLDHHGLAACLHFLHGDGHRTDWHPGGTLLPARPRPCLH